MSHLDGYPLRFLAASFWALVGDFGCKGDRLLFRFLELLFAALRLRLTNSGLADLIGRLWSSKVINGCVILTSLALVVDDGESEVVLLEEPAKATESETQESKSYNGDGKIVFKYFCRK